MSIPWQVSLLGGVSVEKSGEVLLRFRAQKFGALLAYLALFPNRTHFREEIAALFWPDATSETGRQNLRTTLAALRRELEAVGVPLDELVFVQGRDTLELNRGMVITDVARFENALRQARRPDSDHAAREVFLVEAATLYAGPLLPGIYENWSLIERDRLADAYLAALSDLTAHYEQAGEMEAALVWARKALTADPLREKTHEDIIRVLLVRGDRSGAVRQYQELTRLLSENLGAEPSPHLRTLLEEQRETRTEVAVAETHPIVGHVVPRTPSVELSTPSLPAQFTPFFGREAEQETLVSMIQDRHTRLVTLTGPGGCGKTRLSVETARQLTTEVPGGIWFVPLADLRDAERIPEAIAEALGIVVSPDSEAKGPVISTLQQKEGRTLLLLDNFEQVVTGADIVRELLARVPYLTCLVTSRQRLQLEAEREFPVMPLPVPAHPGTPERMQEFSSVQLFVSRAKAARSDFELRAANAEVVGELVRRLEGIALALELAAAWSGVLTPSQMLMRLGKRFDLLVSRRRDISERHETLRATIEWSWELLSPDLQRFFTQLSVFRGGWTLEAAETILDEPRALLFLTELRDRSLIYAVEEDATNATPLSDPAYTPYQDAAPYSKDIEPVLRFRMLETVREFAEERIGVGVGGPVPRGRPGGWEEPFGIRHLISREDPSAPPQTPRPPTPDPRLPHAHYFLRYAEETRRHLRGPEQGVWLSRLEADADNFRTALEYCFGDGKQHESGLRIAASLDRFWLLRNLVREGREYLRRGLAEGEPIAPAVRRDALCVAAWLAWRVRDKDETVAYAEDGLTLARQQGDSLGAAACLTILGLVAQHSGDPQRGIPLLEEAVQLARHSGDPSLIGRCLRDLSWVLSTAGRGEEAYDLLQESLRILRASGDLYLIGLVLRNMGNLLFTLGRTSEARPVLDEAIAFLRRTGDVDGIVWLHLALSHVASDADDMEAARTHCETALRVSRSIGDSYGAIHVLITLANLCLELEDLPATRTYFIEALRVSQQLDYPRGIAITLEGFSRLAVAEKSWERVLTLLAAADAIRTVAAVPMENHVRPFHDANRTEAQNTLGEPNATNAWATGAAMTVEAACAYAEGFGEGVGSRQ